MANEDVKMPKIRGPKNVWEEDGFDLEDVPNLTAQEEIFCQHFGIYSNGIQAFKKAYPDSKTQNAAINASLWLRRPDIAKRINQVRIARAKRLNISGDRILVELARIAFYDKSMVYGPTGERLREHEQDPDTLNALQPKPADKIKALELLGKHQKLFTERIEHAGDLTVEVVKFAGIDPDTGKILRMAPWGTNTDDQAMRKINGEYITIRQAKERGLWPKDEPEEECE